MVKATHRITDGPDGDSSDGGMVPGMRPGSGGRLEPQEEAFPMQRAATTTAMGGDGIPTPGSGGSGGGTMFGQGLAAQTGRHAKSKSVDAIP